MAALREIAEAGVSSLRIEEAGARLIEAVGRNLGTRAALVAVERDGRLEAVASAGYPPGFVDERMTPVPESSVLGRAFRERRTVLVHDIDRDELSEWSRGVSQELGFGAFAGLPLMNRGLPFGAVVFVWQEARAFTPDEISFLESVAAAASSGLQNARMFDETARARQHLTDLLDSMTDGFVSVDRKWRYTLVNPEAERLIGRPAAELLDKSMEDLFPDMFGWPHYRRVMEERVAETFEVWSKPLGTWLEVHAYPTAEGMSILFADISRRKRTEALTSARLHMMTAANSGQMSVDDMTRTVLDEIEQLTAAASRSTTSSMPTRRLSTCRPGRRTRWEPSAPPRGRDRTTRYPRRECGPTRSRAASR